MKPNSNCIFCKIVKGEVPSFKVYEDKEVLAFLDVSPVNPGHVLVIPKEHFETLLDIPNEKFTNLMPAMKKIAKAIMESMNSKGFNLGMNNYELAGQIVPHAHFHIIPRFKDDGLKHWPNQKFKGIDMKQIEGRIKKEIK